MYLNQMEKAAFKTAATLQLRTAEQLLLRKLTIYIAGEAMMI